MTRVLDVVAGARPNFMKVAPILRALPRQPDLSARLVHTGQHYDEGMSLVFFRELGIRAPDVHLGVGSGSHGAQTARVLAAFEEHLEKARPRSAGVVVVGDVNSTMACTLAASKLGIRTAHVEAGLRSFDRTMPEEINRLVTDAIADLLFVSEPAGVENLEREGVAAAKIRYVGNVMIDTLAHELPAARALRAPAKFGVSPRSYGLVTLHRPSNVDDPARLGACVALLRGIAERLQVVFPVHPRTRERLERFGLLAQLADAPGIRLTAPIGYRENLGLMAEARFVLTDSGGMQEETSFLEVPCLTLRSNTERPVTLSRGTSTLVGDDLSAVPLLLEEILAGRYRRSQPIEGWDGRAAERIVDALAACWS